MSEKADASALLLWAMLEASVNGRSLIGTPGVRDPEAPCEQFSPGRNAGLCETDGHYLCDECSECVPRCFNCKRVPRYCECNDDRLVAMGPELTPGDW
jgi:hypothetical protein